MDFKPGSITAVRSATAGALACEPAVTAAEWTRWLRQIERKRRLLGRFSPPHDFLHLDLPASLLAHMTASSFRLDGLPFTDAQVEQAMTAGPSRRPLSSRLNQRLRNHLAILRGIQRLLASGKALTAAAVVRWYTSISCGLCNTRLDETTMLRLQSVVGRVSSPRLRLQPAVQEVARLHCQLMIDPLVPSFNGILARLLLYYHLGRCGLPPVMFDPPTDREMLSRESRLLPRLMELIDASYSLLLPGKIRDIGGSFHGVHG